MSKFFTYLWKNKQWNKKLECKDSKLISYAASNKFISNGVTNGSFVFIVTVIKGELYLGGFIKVYIILNKYEAANYLSIEENELWDANEYILAEKGKEEIFKQIFVPTDLSHNLEFMKGKGFVNPVVRNGRIDEQTFRNVRQLNSGCEKLLFNLLK